MRTTLNCELSLGVCCLLVSLPALAGESGHNDHERPLVQQGVLGTVNVLRELDNHTFTNRVTVTANVDGKDSTRPEYTIDGSGKIFRPNVDPSKPLVLTYRLPGPRTVSSLVITYEYAQNDAPATVRLEGSSDGGKTWFQVFNRKARKSDFLKCFRPTKVNMLRLTQEGDGSDKCCRRTMEVFVYADPDVPLSLFGGQDSGAFSFLRGLWYADKITQIPSPENNAVWTGPGSGTNVPDNLFRSEIAGMHRGCWGEGKEVGKRLYLRFDLDRAHPMNFGLIGCVEVGKNEDSWTLAGESQAEFYTANGRLDPGTLKGSSIKDLTGQGWILQKTWNKNPDPCKGFLLERPGKYNQMLLVWDCKKGWENNRFGHLEMFGFESPAKAGKADKQQAETRLGAASNSGVKPVEPPQGLQPVPAWAGESQWQAVPLVPQAVLDARIRPGGEGGHAGSAAFPLKPSTDGRYLMDARGTPFFVHADTAWQAPKWLSLKEFSRYLDHRAGLAFNTVMLHTFSKEVTPVNNLNGDRPFEPIDDVTKPVEAYWQHLDAMLDLAERRSFLVMIAPLWIRWGGDDRQGWRNQLTEANAPVYGQWLGRRYTERKNIVWILGGDANPGEKTAAINALGKAIKAAAPHHLLCVHNAPENSSARYFGDSDWLDINLAYTYRETHLQVLGEWSRTGKSRPIVLGESGYEEESNDGRDGTPWRVRRQAYGAVLSGSLGGHAFGQKHLWRMDDQWRQAMDSPGSRQMAYVKQLFATRAWWKLRPDERGELVTAGRGKPGENTWVSAAITDDRTLGIIYLPKSRPIKVNFGRMAMAADKGVRAQWMDPLDGRMLSIKGAPFKTEGEHNLVPPARNAGEDTDWILLLEAEVPAAAITNSLEPQWQAVPLVPQAVLDAGIRPGGEGGQWPQAICIDPVDGQLLLYGTDVGGIFRSLDGGKTFGPCNRGYTPRGNCGFAIDPVNINRALAIGANSLEMDCHGIYLTTDQGASWTHVLPKRTKGYRDFREQVAFDRSSYDAGAGCCKVAYWSAAASSADGTGRLYRSTDGGKTWAEMADSQSLGQGIVKVHPAKGYVYVANGGGLFKSMDGGRNFAQKVQGGITGLDVVATQPDMVFACKGNEVLVSRDAGETFTSVTPGGLPGKRNLLQIRVSPANVNRMVIESNQGDYQWQKYYSTDGGKTWALAKHDNRLAILPYNPRQPMFAMHAKDEQVAWSFGGDWITRTADGGATWAWANNGNNGIMVGGRFNFNVQDPDLLYFTAVDYNGALTTDGGRTWTYINLSQIHWGGSISAGYAATPQILYGVMDNRMRITRDGGKTVTNVGGVSQYGARVSYGAPTDPNVLFCCNLRSTDRGQHWAPMNGCDGVFTSSPAGGRELYGRNNRSLVKSADKGATWAVLASLPGGVGDVAYDHVRNRVYATSNERLYQYDVGAGALKEITPAIPADQFGARRTQTVAVDPVDPSVVYVGGARDVYSTDTAVVRSTDAGQTWQSLIRSVRIDNVKTGPDGGREAIAIRVHPKTRYAYVGTGCYGFWKFGPPAAQGGNAGEGPRS